MENVPSRHRYPSFPDGLTVLDANGQWRGSDNQIQREASKLLIVLVPIDVEDLIDHVSNEKKSRFQQESVLKSVINTCVSF